LCHPLILGYLKHLNMTFGEKIILLRKQLKWSQDDLAKKIGTSGPIVGRYERNEIKPSIDVAAKLADTLGVTIDYLVGATEKAVLDKKLMRRIEDIEGLPEDEKDKVYYFIDMALAYNKTKLAFSNK
jgi:transcriptional regulator with XRE-family HTH domain